MRVGGACDADEHEHVCGTSTRTPTSPLLQCCPSTEATAYKTQIKKHEMNADEGRKYFLSGGRPKCRCHGECGATHLYPTLLNPSPRLPLFLIHIYHHSPDGEPISADSTVRSSPLPSFQLHHDHGVGGVELSFNGDVRERLSPTPAKVFARRWAATTAAPRRLHQRRHHGDVRRLHSRRSRHKLLGPATRLT